MDDTLGMPNVQYMYPVIGHFVLGNQLRVGVSVSILCLVVMEWGEGALVVAPCFELTDV